MFGLLFIFSIVLLMSCAKKKIEEEYLEAKKSIADSVYMKKGNSIVSLTFDTLRSSLLSAISTHGMDGAIAFCHEKAYPLTTTFDDSVVIRRTSLRIRNSNNNPDSLELLILKEMEELVQSAKMPAEKIVRHPATGEIHFFKPILLQAMCLNCHGAPGSQIQNATLVKIKQLYPEDQAVNFKEGDLRGVWHIVFNAEKNRHSH